MKREGRSLALEGETRWDTKAFKFGSIIKHWLWLEKDTDGKQIIQKMNIEIVKAIHRELEYHLLKTKEFESAGPDIHLAARG